MAELSSLMQIQPFVQAYVLAVASILDAPVTVVDCNQVRVGGTAEYESLLGQKIAHSAFFDKVFKSGKPAFIKNVQNDQACRVCANRENCNELADMAYPIFLNNEVAGVIGIVAFNEDERGRLLGNQKKLQEFLKYMSMLIESKLVTQQHSRILEHQLDAVVSGERKQLEETPLLGNSAAIRDILALVQKIAASDSTVLISGESGTGKEVLARTIHSMSGRGKRLMTAVNCGAIPENLVESELFGYEEGAFTGARKGGSVGKFELAHESTLFLDEVGEMPLPVQAKLLRVLQDKCVQRVGGSVSIPVNVRIVCASNRNLQEMVALGTFRNDLYYRLNVIPIHIPPLRQRREDIPVFVKSFLARYGRELRREILGLDPVAYDAFMGHDWPGNVRELRNIIEYLVNVVEGPLIRANDLPQHFFARQSKEAAASTLKEMLAVHEKQLLERLIGAAGSTEQKKLLAQRLGVSNATLYRKLQEYNLLH